MSNLSVQEYVSLIFETVMGENVSESDLVMITDGYLAQDALTRKAAAKITHLFIREKLGIKDLEDINPAETLRDLYDCRTCVNHIAQVYLRGIMEPVEIPGVSEKPFLIFDGKAHVSKEEAEKIAIRVKNIASNP